MLQSLIEENKRISAVVRQVLEEQKKQQNKQKIENIFYVLFATFFGKQKND